MSIRRTFAFLTAAVLATSALAAPIQWTAASGGNDHYYDIVDSAGITYQAAQAAAASSSYLGLAGHLLVLDTPTYTPEYNFVYNNVYTPHGGPNLQTYWIGAEQIVIPGHSGDQDWIWEDAQPVPTSITSTWDIDHNEGSAPGMTYGAVFFGLGHGLGDYGTANQSGYSAGYVIEYAVPEPASLSLLGAAALLLRRRRHA